MKISAFAPISLATIVLIQSGLGGLEHGLIFQQASIFFGEPLPKTIEDPLPDDAYLYRWDGDFDRERASLESINTVEFMVEQIDDVHVANLEGLDNIENLVIEGFDWGIEISERNLSRLVNRPRLKGLHVKLATADENRLAALGENQYLEVLSIRSTSEEAGIVEFTDRVFEAIAGHKNLREIFLHGNGLSDKGVMKIASGNRLELIVLTPIRGRTRLTASALHAFNSESLEFLDIHLDEKITHDFSALSKFTKLESLLISGAEVNSSFFEAIPFIKELRLLVIEIPKVTDVQIRSLVQLPNLSILRLNCDKDAFDTRHLEYLSNIKNLTELTMVGVRASNEDLKYFEKHPKIEIINFEEFDVNMETCLIVERIPTLRRLYFRTRDSTNTREVCEKLDSIFRRRDREWYQNQQANSKG